MADADAEVFCDPENEDSLVDVVQKTMLSCIAKNLVGVVEDVAATAAAEPEQATCHGETVPSGGREETDGGAAVAAAAAAAAASGRGGVVSKLVVILGGLVAKIVRGNRKELEALVAQLVRQTGEQLKSSINKILGAMFLGKEFKWSYLIVFLAFAALLVYRKGPGAELVALARTVATCVGELIVKMWRAAFVALGGWFGFLKGQSVDGAPVDYSLAGRVGSGAFYAVLLVAFGYGLYCSGKDAVSQPPKLE